MKQPEQELSPEKQVETRHALGDSCAKTLFFDGDREMANADIRWARDELLPDLKVAAAGWRWRYMAHATWGYHRTLSIIYAQLSRMDMKLQTRTSQDKKEDYFFPSMA